MQKVAIDEVKDSQAKGVKTVLAGDGRYDSPGEILFLITILYKLPSGYSASFCTYSLQSLATNKILSLWVAHKSMVRKNI